MQDTSQVNVAAKVPVPYLRRVTNHRDALMAAKWFCALGASLSHIEEVAVAIEARAKALKLET